eukprot:1857230-Amphidinium_carterae.1
MKPEQALQLEYCGSEHQNESNIDQSLGRGGGFELWISMITLIDDLSQPLQASSVNVSKCVNVSKLEALCKSGLEY